jgi:hypothetical protein
LQTCVVSGCLKLSTRSPLLAFLGAVKDEIQVAFAYYPIPEAVLTYRMVRDA